MTNGQDFSLQLDGVIRANLGAGKYRVELARKHCIIVEASAKIKVRLTSLLVGDIVRCEFSPIEPGKVRIAGHAGAKSSTGCVAGSGS
jgi:translation initiation factor IF-1